MQDIEPAREAFVMGAKLPSWADLKTAPPTAVQREPTPLTIRLWETQLRSGAAPVELTHWVVQVHHANALSEIGQLMLEFNPQDERLLLHQLVIERDSQRIDHLHSATVRLLQREAKLEQGIYNGTVTASIVLPRVRVGDSLHLVYSVVANTPGTAYRYAHRAFWDQRRPIAWRRVTLVQPLDGSVRWRWGGGAGSAGPTPTETVVANQRQLLFEARNVAAIVTEPTLPPRIEARRSLFFSDYAGWNDVARWAQPLFPVDTRLPPEMDPVITRLRSIVDPQERTAQALRWVQGEIRNWSIALGEHAVRPRLPAEVIERGFGDCKDKSLLLSTMLRDLNVDARPALVSVTTRNGPAFMLPSPEVFDHAIVQVKLANRAYYLDPTNPTQFGLLSRLGQRLEGASTLPIDAETQDLVTVSSPNRDQIFGDQLAEHFMLHDVNAEARLDVETAWSGVHAEAVRVLLAHMKADHLRSFVSTGYLQKYPGIRLLDAPEVHDDPVLNKVILRARFAVPNLAQAVSGRWAMTFSPNLGDAIEMPNPVPRRFPLALPSFPTTYSFRVDMTWPKGMAIDEGLASLPLETPHFQMLTTRSVHGNTETRTIVFRTKVGEVAAEDLAAFAASLILLEDRIGGVMSAWPAPEPAPQP